MTKSTKTKTPKTPRKPLVRKEPRKALRPKDCTRLWLATYYLKMPVVLALEGVRLQRLLVARLDWNERQVKQQANKFGQDVYAIEDVEVTLESVKPLKDLRELALNLLSVNLIDETQAEGITPDQVPTKLVVEVAYDDFSPLSQHTPSRGECVAFPSRIIACEAQRLADEWVERKHPELESLVTIYPEGSSYSDVSDDPKAAVDLVHTMLEEMYGDKEE